MLCAQTLIRSSNKASSVRSPSAEHWRSSSPDQNAQPSPFSAGPQSVNHLLSCFSCASFAALLPCPLSVIFPSHHVHNHLHLLPLSNYLSLPLLLPFRTILPPPPSLNPSSSTRPPPRGTILPDRIPEGYLNSDMIKQLSGAGLVSAVAFGASAVAIEIAFSKGYLRRFPGGGPAQ